MRPKEYEDPKNLTVLFIRYLWVREKILFGSGNRGRSLGIYGVGIGPRVPGGGAEIRKNYRNHNTYDLKFKISPQTHPTRNFSPGPIRRETFLLVEFPSEKVATIKCEKRQNCHMCVVGRRRQKTRTETFSDVCWNIHFRLQFSNATSESNISFGGFESTDLVLFSFPFLK